VNEPVRHRSTRLPQIRVVVVGLSGIPGRLEHMFDTVVEIGDRLAGLVDTLDPDRVTGSHAGDLWDALNRVERLAAAGKTLLARRVADTHRPDRAGARSAAEALARRAGTTVGAAQDAVDTSARLADLPQVAAAVRRGDLSPAQAALVSGAAAADPRNEHRLVELAGQSSLAELREECARVKAGADPDPQATNHRLHTARRLRRYTDDEGAWNLIARGTPQAGAAFNAILDPIIDAVFRAARREDRREPAEAYAFDALLELARRAAGHQPPPPSRPADGAEPTRDAPADRTADTGTGDTAATHPDDAPDDARPAPAAAGPADPHATDPHAADPDPAAPGTADPGAADPGARRRVNPRFLALLRIDLEALLRGRVAGDELCEITGVGPVPVEVARGLLGDAVLKLVLTRGVDVGNVTHLGRGPTAAQKIALAWTNPTCSVEGCYRSRIEYDHRDDYARTRHTRLDELDPLCGYHHGLKTRHGWALVAGTGKRAMIPPDDHRHPRHQPLRA